MKICISKALQRNKSHFEVSLEAISGQDKRGISTLYTRFYLHVKQ
jgi:hypothetical protein